MAGIAGSIGIGISTYARVMTVSFCFVVSMAKNATECSVISGSGVTGITRNIGMLSSGNREILSMVKC
jgi:hypothetical protein